VLMIEYFFHQNFTHVEMRNVVNRCTHLIGSTTECSVPRQHAKLPKILSLAVTCQKKDI
jgi:hypothetical protein